MAEKELKCKDLVKKRLRSRINELRRLWKGYQSDDESLGEEFNNYALSFDYVAPGTFRDQEQGYFRYQISWGGPSDDFRFYVNPDFSCYSIEYWYLDWFDGASVTLAGKDKELMREIFDSFRETETTDYVYRQAMND
jgi:hypothetical protein